MYIYGMHRKLGVRRFTWRKVLRLIDKDGFKSLDWKECISFVFVSYFHKPYIFVNTMVRWNQQIVYPHDIKLFIHKKAVHAKLYI